MATGLEASSIHKMHSPIVMEDFEAKSSLAFRRQAGSMEKDVYRDNTSDDIVIARFGKKPQLKRRFKSLSSIGLICGMMLTWVATIVTLRYGLYNGGPAGILYGFLAAWSGAILQSLVLAEISSMIPLTGGPFNWVAILAPPSSRKFLSYLAGWLTVIGWQAFVSAVGYAAGTLVQSLAVLQYPDYVPEQWHGTLLTYAVILFGFFMNTYLGRILPQVESLMLIVYLLGFFAILIPIAYLAPHQSASAVFTTFSDQGDWGSLGTAFFVGWYVSTTSFLGGDGAEHIAEEIQNAQKVIPLSICVSTLLNGVLGFSMLLAVIFSIQDFDAIANSTSLYPIFDIFIAAVDSHAGGIVLSSLLTFIQLFCISSVMATASRTLWAFSRENALPFSKFLVKVHPETRLPINAIMATVGISLVLSLISLTSSAAFLALFSIVTSAYFSSFIISASVMLHKRLTEPPDETPWGPFRLGRAGVPVTVIAICYSTLAMFWTFWPSYKNPAPADVNYSIVIFGAAIIFSLCFWLAHGRRHYHGPIWELEQ